MSASAGYFSDDSMLQRVHRVVTAHVHIEGYCEPPSRISLGDKESGRR